MILSTSFKSKYSIDVIGGNISTGEAAKALVQAGADAVKFQMHIASEESTVDEKFRIRISSQYKSRYEYWEKTSFKNEEWNEIINHCKKYIPILLPTVLVCNEMVGQHWPLHNLMQLFENKYLQRKKTQHLKI